MAKQQILEKLHNFKQIFKSPAKNQFGVSFPIKVIKNTIRKFRFFVKILKFIWASPLEPPYTQNNGLLADVLEWESTRQF